MILCRRENEQLTPTLTRTAQLIRIRAIELHRVRVPLIEPFRISNGEVTEKEAILIEVLTDGGIVGWGEASPMSGTFYSGDTPETVCSSLTESLIPSVLNAAEIDVRSFFKNLRDQSGDAFARAGLEGALWDACAIKLGVPLCELLGGRARAIPSGVAIGIYDHVGDLIERVDRYVEQGYRRVKIKIEPGWDIEPVAAVRARYPNLPIMVDANAAYSLDDAGVFRALDAYHLMMIEQPLARESYAEAGELQRQLRTPLCADESAGSTEALTSLIAHGAARIVNIKVQRVGGLGEARQMLDLAHSSGLKCWVGTMPELGVASAQGLHFAALEGFTYPTDIEASSRWYVDDVLTPAIEIDPHGYIKIPAGPGMGYTVVREKVEQYSVDTVRFKN
jgi:O-succinylbenzoate synthase